MTYCNRSSNKKYTFFFPGKKHQINQIIFIFNACWMLGLIFYPLLLDNYSYTSIFITCIGLGLSYVFTSGLLRYAPISFKNDKMCRILFSIPVTCINLNEEWSLKQIENPPWTNEKSIVMCVVRQENRRMLRSTITFDSRLIRFEELICKLQYIKEGKNQDGNGCVMS